jgi:ribonucleoside-diphosphate reductase alpha chain
MQPDEITALPLSQMIWREKYRLADADKGIAEGSIADTWRRVAKAAAQAEAKGERKRWAREFEALLAGYAFLPGGRILAGAGARRDLTLFNCFVMNRIGDDMSSIFDNLREGALTMQKGGGIGVDFSSLRPAGAPVKGVGADASGPVSFMEVWDAMCGTILSAGARRGAMMGTLAVDHPDIEAFIGAKSKPGHLKNFNLSVLVSDAFMAAVAADDDWPLRFGGKVFRTLKARALFERIMRATYEQAEPGVIFIDRINARNKLGYCEAISATNPCGEQPLPPYGACMLGSLNLTRLVRDPFTPRARLDETRLQELTRLAVRFLDDIIDVSRYPLPQQEREAKAKRRIGLGITGLADALVMCNERYGSEPAQQLTARWMRLIQSEAYRASARLAAEKGTFPLYDAAAHLAHPDLRWLDADALALVREHGLRNGLLTSIAPTGTISLLAGNVSGGIEPIFDLAYSRRVRHDRDLMREELVEDYAYRLFRHLMGETAKLPAAFVTAQQLSPADHLAMQAALQPHVDSAISKTINCPETISFEDFKSVYADAYRLGLKGCTTYRPNAITGSLLKPAATAEHGEQAAPAAPAPAEAGGGETLALPLPVPSLVRPGAAGLRSDAGVVYMAEPMERSAALAGFTYKLKWPDSEHAIYITINDVMHNGRRRPFEIFINSKNLEHYAWTVALTRMISAVFRRGGDVAFVVEELKAVFDPRGGQWMNGHYVPSLLAAIGEVVEKHMIDIGFLVAPAGGHSTGVEGSGGCDEAACGTEAAESEAIGGQRRAGFCPRCARPSLVFREGCYSCRHCDYSRCS